MRVGVSLKKSGHGYWGCGGFSKAMNVFLQRFDV
jgi:hypothetical protein